MKLEPKYQKALDKFVEKYKKNKRVIGIILTGGMVHSKPDKNSDLDVFIVLDKSKTRERGNTKINGVEVEYFINPVEQIKYEFKKDFERNKGHTANMFSNSIVLYKKGDKLDSLIKMAKKSIRKPLKKMDKMKIEMKKYSIDDYEKDLEDALVVKDEFSFNHMANRILEESLEIFLGLKRKIMEKPKRLLNFLKKEDIKFAKLYENAVLEKNMSKRYNSLIKLVRYVESSLGGKRTKEWKITSKCPYLKK